MTGYYDSLIKAQTNKHKSQQLVIILSEFRQLLQKFLSRRDPMSH